MKAEKKRQKTSNISSIIRPWKLCKECGLFPVESELVSRKIEPSSTHCKDCVRMNKLMSPSYKPKEKKPKKSIIEKIFKESKVSMAYLMRKYGLSFEHAKELIEELDEKN